MLEKINILSSPFHLHSSLFLLPSGGAVRERDFFQKTKFAADVHKVSSHDVRCGSQCLDKLICLLLCQNCFSQNIEGCLAPRADSFSKEMQVDSWASVLTEIKFTLSGLSELVLY